MPKIIFIDRDGVINEDLWGYVTKPEDFKFMDGVLPALKKLTEAQYKIVIISNQAGVGDGLFEKEDLDAVTEYMMKTMIANGSPAAGVFYCMHGKEEGCDCRKPKVGLFEKAAEAFSFSPQETFYIGDKITDVEAGKNVNLRTILVLTGYGEKDQEKITDNCKPDFIEKDLEAAVNRILTI